MTSSLVIHTSKINKVMSYLFFPLLTMHYTGTPCSFHLVITVFMNLELLILYRNPKEKT